MAQLISVRLQRSDASPWGFRLQGGVDFAAPLVIQKVNGGSIAERAGLQAGDAVLRVNSSEVFNLRHKEAQDVIIRAGPSFEMTIQRGSSTWKPTVTPVGPMATQNANLANVTPITKTSLAANKPVSAPIGSGHNVSAKPFLNGSSDVRLVNKQYNSPVGLYSEQSIAETLSAQTEVLSTGALGVNFKKNEKTYNPVNSEVLKMVQEAENEPRDSEPAYISESEPAAAPTSAPVNASGLRHVTAPVFSPPAPSPAGPTKPLAPGQNICADCERLIVGVFVRIKDKNLHVECFKCATCGASLKNVGYYNINNKLYCDVHAKLAARNNPPAPNLVPVTIPPGSKLPSGTISQALQSHSLPSPSPLSPSVLPAAPPSAPSTFTPASMDCAKNNNNNVALNDYPALSLNNVVLFANTLDKMESRNNRKNSNAEIVHNGNDNNDTKKIFTSETKISVNNNNSFNEKDLNRFEKVISLNNGGVQPGSNVFSGPRPFSNAAAPMPSMSSVSAPATNNYASTLPRAAGTTQPVHARGHSDELVVRNAPVVETNNKVTIDFKNHLKIINDALANNGFRVNCPPKNDTNGSNAVTKTTGQYSSDDNDDDKDTSTLNVQKMSPPTKTISNFVQRTNDKNIENGSDTNNCFKQQIINSSNNGDCESDLSVGNVNGCSKTHEIDNVSEVVPSSWKSNSKIATLELVDGAYPVCVQCKEKIKRGPFISALGKIWCPEHFVCATPQCRRPLQDLGFVEEQGLLYCETCFEQYLAPTCCQCRNKIKGDCLKAIGKHYHPECFNCFYCGKAFGNNPFFLEDAQPYCEADWNELFTTKCFACGFPVEAGDRWVEALNNNYHSQCFNCAMCKKNLEGQSFYAKGGRPFCKNHAR